MTKSGPEYLLDTDICIYIAKQNPHSVRHRFEMLQPIQLAMSVITWGELRFGAQKSLRKSAALQTLASLRELIQVLPLSEFVAEHYGDIREALQSRGQSIGNNDLWIAAHARASALTLVTHNTRVFERVKDLKLEDWA